MWPVPFCSYELESFDKYSKKMEFMLSIVQLTTWKQRLGQIKDKETT